MKEIDWGLERGGRERETRGNDERKRDRKGGTGKERETDRQTD